MIFPALGYHAIGGPITMEQPRYQPKLKQGASRAAVKMGYHFVDSNGDQQTGISLSMTGKNWPFNLLIQ